MIIRLPEPKSYPRWVTSYCIFPLFFEDKIYWLEKVKKEIDLDFEPDMYGYYTRLVKRVVDVVAERERLP